jgi:hypothetical protein
VISWNRWSLWTAEIALGGHSGRVHIEDPGRACRGLNSLSFLYKIKDIVLYRNAGAGEKKMYIETRRDGGGKMQWLWTWGGVGQSRLEAEVHLGSNPWKGEFYQGLGHWSHPSLISPPFSRTDDESLKAASVNAVCFPDQPCQYRKLDPNVLMMYSSEERNCGNLPDALNASSDRCVLAQGEVSPHLIVIGSV